MQRALLLVARWLGLAHDRWREATTRRPLAVEIDLLRELVVRYRAENDLLRARLARLDPPHRPRYRPWERLRILWHQARYGLSLRATARAFLLSTQTLVNWHKDAASSAGKVVAARVPLNRICDLAAEIACRIRAEWPRWGTRRIAGILARLGLRASRSSVQRALRRPSRPFPKAALRPRRGRTLTAKHPNHIWMLDLTPLRRPLRTLLVGAVIDACSRRVHALRVNASRPHQGLGQRTPDEVHFGRATAATSVPVHPELEVRLHDGQHDMPVFTLRHAA